MENNFYDINVYKLKNSILIMAIKNPNEMGLGEIVRELNLLSSIKTLTSVIGQERAYSTMAPNYCRNSSDLITREDQLYSELNRR